MLKTTISDSSKLLFVSDKNRRAIAEVYLMSQHGYCIYYLSHSVKLSVTQNMDEVAK
ncbi:unnamed protein product [Brassica oleracea]